MARLGCPCGAAMSTVDCPSPHVYHVFTQAEVTAALNKNSECLFWDFYTNWDSQKDEKCLFTSEDFSYWYCTACGRMYQVQAKPQGRWVKKYQLSEDISFLTDEDIVKWEKLYVYSDKVVDQITEKDFKITLSAFLNHKKHVYEFYISPCSSIIAVCDKKTKAIVKVYLLEESV
jgi:hypothetical protein